MTFIISELEQQNKWSKVRYVSAEGLVPIVKQLGQTIVGVEIGVAGGWNMNYFLQQIPNLKLTGIDPYQSYMETRGSDGKVVNVDQSVLDEHYAAAIENTKMFGHATIIRAKSIDVVDMFPDNSLDYIFIDGDHSYSAVLQDCRNYYSKVKKGGVFAGHDIGLQQVQAALTTFVQETKELQLPWKTTQHQVWYWHKP